MGNKEEIKTGEHAVAVDYCDLLDCPFCGKVESEDHDFPATIYNGLDEFTDKYERGNPPYYIQCEHCLGRGPTADNPVDASKWWNDRKTCKS